MPRLKKIFTETHIEETYQFSYFWHAETGKDIHGVNKSYSKEMIGWLCENMHTQCHDY